ncbi:formin-binding protein 4-like [Phlebotomus argentipes]|uniref:formin-binding protein 4-like n=1 Tax=Phlebotomus argentipes TaxID=94469 RepID=UPI0028933AC9|nr:formin-binding protein 4-like [Phlebotomus argentipes]
MLPNGSENRLTHLLGAYNSDSDDEESAEEQVQRKHGNNGASVADNITQTEWTQCFDRDTGHPYFWHISTKEVTWEMPEEYRAYLEWVMSSTMSSEHRWKVYEAEDGKATYYVDEVTRVVSWDMPEEFRKHLAEQKKEKPKEKVVKKRPVKKYPEHLMKDDSNEEKIELISSYSRSSDSEEDEKDNGKVEDTAERTPTPDQIPSEELLPYKMHTHIANTDAQAAERSPNHATTSTLFSNETSVTLSELEKTYSAVRKSPESAPRPEAISISTCEEEMDVKLTMRKRRIEVPRILPKSQPPAKVDKDVEVEKEEEEQQVVNADEDVEEIVERKEFKDASTSTAEDEENSEDLKTMSSLISAKVKFLSEGRPIVTGVQVMQIQLETLLTAFEAQQLTRCYVMKWLKSTAKSLLQLENEVAPNGWKCKWDRKNSRYYYQSMVTGKIQWDFPEPDVTCHDDEMEICTTPPHPGGVEEGEPEAKKPKQEENSNELRTPEPPTWNSSPEASPAPPFDAAPPPPRITDKFHTELDSFYSDLASMDSMPNPTEAVPAEASTEVAQTTSAEQPKVKKKKVKTSRTEMKQMSMLMAKWHKAQQDLKK